MHNLLEIRNKTAAYFEKCGVPNARYDAELILAHCLQLTRMQLFLNFDRPLKESELDAIRPLVARRGKREPLQYVLGTTSFRGIEIKCDSRALIPRPETETLVDHALELLKGVESPYILDIGTGTGAISIAMATQLPLAKVLAVDISEDALQLALYNVQANKLFERIELQKSNLFENITANQQFDLIISNPPYIPIAQKEHLQQEVVQYEPHLALFSGVKGLDLANILIEQARKYLKDSGKMILELGEEHYKDLETIKIEEKNSDISLCYAECLSDLDGVKRFSVFLMKKAVD